MPHLGIQRSFLAPMRCHRCRRAHPGPADCHLHVEVSTERQMAGLGRQSTLHKRTCYRPGARARGAGGGGGGGYLAKQGQAEQWPNGGSMVWTKSPSACFRSRRDVPQIQTPLPETVSSGDRRYGASLADAPAPWRTDGIVSRVSSRTCLCRNSAWTWCVGGFGIIRRRDYGLIHHERALTRFASNTAEVVSLSFEHGNRKPSGSGHGGCSSPFLPGRLRVGRTVAFSL